MNDVKKLLLIYNPHSGKAEFVPQLGNVVTRFVKAGYEVTVYPTRRAHDAYDMILRRAEAFDFLCCAGGDGTLDEAISAMMLLKTKPQFGYIPSGTTNDFASSLKIPKTVSAAADAVVAGNPYPIDIGKFGDDYFAYVAAFGALTAVTYDTPQTAKNMLGHAAYLLEGVKRLGSIEAYDCKVNIDGERFSGHFIFGMVSNSTSVGGFKMPLENSVLMDDGLFEVILIKRPRSFADLQNIAASLLGLELKSESLIVRKAKSVRVVSSATLHWTLDGEFGGATTDILIENLQKALEIMIPKPEIVVLDAPQL